MKKAPNIFKLKDLMNCINQCSTQTKDGKAIPARPLGYFGVFHRFKCAYLVFTGKVDCVKWPGNQ